MAATNKISWCKTCIKLTCSEESKASVYGDLFNFSNLSVEEQEQITKDVLNFVEIEGNSMDRTVMRPLYED